LLAALDAADRDHDRCDSLLTDARIEADTFDNEATGTREEAEKIIASIEFE
jgi:hypothetical protein